MGWKTFNDRLALIALGAILGLMAATGLTTYHLPEIVLGALISWGTMVVQFYYRKAKPPDKGGK